MLRRRFETPSAEIARGLFLAGQDFEQIFGLRIAGGAEHSHQAFGRMVRHLGKGRRRA